MYEEQVIGSIIAIAILIGAIAFVASNDSPIASFDTSDNLPLTGSAVVFDARASVDPEGKDLTYSWSFGDGDATTRSKDFQIVSHTFTSPGDYRVTLSVWDPSGNRGTKSMTMSVQPGQPTVSIASSGTEGRMPLEVTFLATTRQSWEADAISTYRWDFGDGNTSRAGNRVSHTYTIAGIYTASLVVETTSGETLAVDTVQIRVLPPPGPIAASIEVDASTGYVPHTVVFDGSGSTQEDGNVTSYEWSFGDGTYASGSVVEHTFTEPGDYTVFLEIRSDLGGTDDETLSIRVLPEKPDNTVPNWGNGSQSIAFVSTRDSDEEKTNYEIYVTSAAGQDLTRVTNNRGADLSPVWSPDGERFAFVSNRDQQTGCDIYIMDLSNGIDRRVVSRVTFRDRGIDKDPCWMPSGSKASDEIVFVSDRDGVPELYRMNLETLTWSRLTYSMSDKGNPTISADGQYVAFEQEVDGNLEIFLMEIDGTNIRRLTFNPADDILPEWSPTEDRIVFASRRDGDWEIYSMDTDGGNKRNLTNNPANDTAPTWSPDGESIAFQSDRTGSEEIVVMTNWGENQQVVTGSSD